MVVSVCFPCARAFAGLYTIRPGPWQSAPVSTCSSNANPKSVEGCSHRRLCVYWSRTQLLKGPPPPSQCHVRVASARACLVCRSPFLRRRSQICLARTQRRNTLANSVLYRVALLEVLGQHLRLGQPRSSLANLHVELVKPLGGGRPTRPALGRISHQVQSLWGQHVSHALRCWGGGRASGQSPLLFVRAR